MNIITATGAFPRKVTNREPKLTQIRAQEIMGRNFFGVEEAVKHFGVNPSTQELAYLAAIPFSEETLTACHHSHILIAVFPLSILEIRDKWGHDVFYCLPRCNHEKEWYNTQAFAEDRGEIDWHLVRRDALPYSSHETWWKQQRLLDMNNEKAPTARVLVYTMAGQILSARECLFIYYGGENVRCADLLSSGDCVVVSGYRPAHPSGGGVFGISLSNRCTNYKRSGHLGIASERNAER